MRKNVPRGLVPSLGGERPAHTTIPRPSDLRVLDIQHRYSGESRNPGGGRGGTNHTKSLPPTGASIFIPWCAGGSRHGRLVRKHVPDSDPGCALQSTSMPAFHRRNVPNCKPMVDGGMSKCSAGACPPLGSGWGVAESAVPIRWTKPQLRLFIPWCAGGNRHGRLARKHVPDSDPGSIPAPAGDTNHRRPNNDSPGSQERNVALGLVPS